MSRMNLLPRKEDPTGFLSLFRMAAMDRFGDPSGFIQGRGCWHHPTKKGPGRAHLTAEAPTGRKHGRPVKRRRARCLEGGKWVGKDVARRGYR